MLELQNLSKSFRSIPAIQDVSFKLAPGEIVGFLGPNGAGKSTTVKIITGMFRPNDGRVLFEGHDIRKNMVAFRSVLGYVPEEAHLYNYLSGLEYLQLVGRLRGLGEALIEAKATRLLKLLHLESWQYSPISSYSKGMRQRVRSPRPYCTILNCSSSTNLCPDLMWSLLDCSRTFLNCWRHKEKQSSIYRTCWKLSSRYAIASSSLQRETYWPMLDHAISPG